MRTGVSIGASGRLDVDVPAVTVTPTLTVNGAAIPASPYVFAKLSVRPTMGGGEATLIYGSQFGSQPVRLVPGRYDVIYDGVASTTLPANTRAVIARDVMIGGGALAFDVDSVRVQGAFRSGADAFPASAYARANIVFTDAELGEVRAGRTDFGSYDTALIAGTYDIFYRVDGAAGVVPINTNTRIVNRRAFTSSQTFNVNIGRVGFSGDFLLNGAPFPMSAYEVADLVLRRVDNGSDQLLGRSNFGDFDVRVIPGRYHVRYRFRSGGDQIPTNSDVRVTPDFDITADTELDVNVRSIQLGGGFTLNGNGFGRVSPDNDAEFAAIETESGSRIPLGRGQLGGFATQLVEGDYELRYRHLGGDLAPQNADARLGCVRVIVPQ